MDMSGLDTEREIDELEARERRRRRFGRSAVWWTLGAAVVLGVAFLPRIASVPAVRERIVARLNASVAPVSVAVDHWRLRWLGGQRLDGVRLYDPVQGLTISIPAVDVSNGLVKLLPFGTIDAGEVTLDQPVVRFTRARAIGPWEMLPATGVVEQAEVRGAGAETAVAAARPFELPKIAVIARLVVRNGQVVVGGSADGETTLADQVNASLRLNTWDQPLMIDAACVVPGGAGDGTVSAKGQLPTPRLLVARAFDDPACAGHMALAITGFDLEQVRPLLEARTGAAWGAGGLLDAEVSVRAAGLHETVVEAEVAITRFTFAFPGFNPSPPADVTVAVSAKRDDRGVAIHSCAVQTPWARLSADGRFGSLSAGAVPVGRIAVTGGVDAAAIIRDFRPLLKLPPEVRMERGTLSFAGVVEGTEQARTLRLKATADTLTVFYKNERVPLMPAPRVTLDLDMPYAGPAELNALDVVLPFAQISGSGRLDKGLISGKIDLTAFSRAYRNLWTACPPMIGQILFQVAAAKKGDRSEMTATVGVEDLAVEIGVGQRIVVERADNQIAFAVPMNAGWPTLASSVISGTLTSAVSGLALQTGAWSVKERDVRAQGTVEVALGEGYLRLSDATLISAAARVSVPALRADWALKDRATAIAGEAVMEADLGVVSGWRRVSREGVAPSRLNGGLHVRLAAANAPTGTRITLASALTNLVIAAAGQDAPMREKRIALSAAALLARDGQTLGVESAELATDWLAATAKGRVRDVTDGATASLTGTLAVDYDALSVKLTEAGVRGVTVSGKPAPRPFECAGGLGGGLASLRSFGAAEGSLGIGEIRVLGLKLAAADVSFAFDEGLLKLDYQPASGTGFLRLKPVIQAAADPAVLEIGGAVPILDRVPLTQEFTDTVLAMLNPLLRGCVVGSGLVELHLNETRIPLAPGAQQQIDATFAVTLREASFTPRGTLADVLDLAGIEHRTMRIPDTTIQAVCRDGRIQSEPFEVAVDGHPIRFRGSVGLDQTVSYLVEVPLTEKLVGRTVWPYLKGQTIRVPVIGTLTALKIDSDAVKKEINRLLKEAGTKALGDVANEQFKRLLRER
jgi:hypothetical protein